MKEYINIEEIHREADLIGYSLENFILLEERKKFKEICEKYIKKYKNYIISEIIKSIRSIYSLTQKQLGELIGKKEITIRKYESGDININSNVLLSIVEALKIKNFNVSDYYQTQLMYPRNENIEENFYYEILSLKSFQNTISENNNLILEFIDGEIKDILINNIINKNNENIKYSSDFFNMEFSKYSVFFEVLTTEKKEKLYNDLIILLDFLKFKYNLNNINPFEMELLKSKKD